MLTDPEDEPDDTSRDVERVALLAHLGAQRRHIVGILDGLDDAALRRPMLPSGWSCLGLVQHLALDVERFWFRAVVAGEQVDARAGRRWLAGPARAAGRRGVRALPGRDPASRRDRRRPRRWTPPAAWWPDSIFPGLAPQPLRETVLHVITETATHAGHLDVVRELIDSRQWMVLT